MLLDLIKHLAAFKRGECNWPTLSSHGCHERGKPALLSLTAVVFAIVLIQNQHTRRKAAHLEDSREAFVGSTRRGGALSHNAQF